MTAQIIPLPQPDPFDSWWSYYPRKISKGTARIAFKGALKKASLETLTTGVKRFAQECEGKDPKFIPHPATWLRGERWLDEPLKATEKLTDKQGRQTDVWASRFAAYRKNGFWVPAWGPKPEHPDYRGPLDLLTTGERLARKEAEGR